MKFKVNENMVVYAFRYALGRRSSAVNEVSQYIKDHWDEFEEYTKEQIQREVKKEIQMMELSDTEYLDGDINPWDDILELEI